MAKDYYSILGITKSATQDEIKKAFRKKAHQYHPDKKDGNEEKFKEVNEAYQILGNPKKREQYDRFGSADFNANGFGSGFGGFSQGGINIDMDDLGDIFSGFGDIFGFGGGRKRQGPKKGNDISMMLEISFEEAIFGTQKEIEFNKKVKCDRCKGNGAEPGTSIDTCPKCNGSGKIVKMQRTFLGSVQMQTTCDNCNGEGKVYSKKCSQCGGLGAINKIVSLKVKIPAGIDNGETIRLNGQGEAGEKGGLNGDLFLKIMVTPSKDFERKDYDIYSKEKINFVQASLGDKIEIKTIYGNVKLKIPEGTQSGTIFRLKDKGVTKLQGRGKGDHFVEIIVEIPKHLSRAQKKILKQLNL